MNLRQSYLGPFLKKKLESMMRSTGIISAWPSRLKIHLMFYQQNILNMFLILIENPSGHGKKIEGVSNTAGMIVRLSGGNKKMRKRTINKLGTHPTQLGVGNS